ncbi:MAG: bifunctional pyr operon transcriptional regulator/uracil phosphoribosyltransferase PyrR [Desulfarculaceae bacterium]|nr:bifunctional pyr operon transcriptional regulator/uracil phosphoribosyltransferase PyrR [Desulfarculaceae bacterium]MCF8073132.1 bifunctional pyr operon transcriptional regulator/uracil phosphoribosyltransferase PyrR [Desulfarculaceae bacterium]MCF8101783.1 bifunctional pyr operon transcriptional regulator/uracil phosphoribosyltransferase PyrR [Desulfarculaceae bacterium]MCF8117347.1 bifunctional pyr operon transcriptional regulator/uracil phosphoribosyltransferase PyrR [Desulfarculaceae bact
MDLSHAEVLFDASQISGQLEALARDIAAGGDEPGSLCLVGIRTGGAVLARRLQGLLAGLLGEAPDTGVMDITLYRDDWTMLHKRPKVGTTEITFEIDERRVVLVDDVLYTGRTVRAALDELMDFGRAQRIELAVLIDRGGRELPIQANHMAAEAAAGPEYVIEVLLEEEGHPRDEVVRLPR